MLTGGVIGVRYDAAWEVGETLWISLECRGEGAGDGWGGEGRGGGGAAWYP